MPSEVSNFMMPINSFHKTNFIFSCSVYRIHIIRLDCCFMFVGLRFFLYFSWWGSHVLIKNLGTYGIFIDYFRMINERFVSIHKTRPYATNIDIKLKQH